MASAVEPARPGTTPSEAYARRFGALLRRHRRRRLTTLRSLASAADPALPATALRAYEHGRRPLDARVLQQLCDLYGIGVHAHLPAHRTVVFDLERRELRIGDHTLPLPASDDPSPHLERYVQVVNRLRSRPMRSPATLRRDDTEAIAEALDLDIDEVTDLLSELIGKDAASRRRLLALRTGTSTLAAVVVVAGASTAMSGTPPEAETAVLSAHTAPPGEDDGDDGHEGGDEIPAAFDLPEVSTVAGPDLHPLPYSPGGGPEATEAFEDETRVDAPGGPVVIERDTGVASSAVGAGEGDAPDEPGSGGDGSATGGGIEDDTWVHAEDGGPVVGLTREEHEASQEEAGTGP